MYRAERPVAVFSGWLRFGAKKVQRVKALGGGGVILFKRAGQVRREGPGGVMSGILPWVQSRAGPMASP